MKRIPAPLRVSSPALAPDRPRGLHNAKSVIFPSRNGVLHHLLLPASAEFAAPILSPEARFSARILPFLTDFGVI